MNAGDFRHKLEILELVETEPDCYKWQKALIVWAKAEHPTGLNSVFAKNAMSAKTVRLTVHATTALSLHNALRLESDGHLALADINRDTPGFLLLTAAVVAPVTCVAERTVTGMGGYNRPAVSHKPPVTFPGIIAEKYLRQTQDEPMSRSDARYVLVTPKVIQLEVGELVTAGGFQCEIVVPHVLDPHKNEYEILRRYDN